MGWQNVVKIVLVQALIFLTLFTILHIKASVDTNTNAFWGDSHNPGAIHTDMWKAHPILMVSAFVVVGSEAALAFRFLPMDHEKRKLVHLTLQTLAVAMALTGILKINRWKVHAGMDHFYNIHHYVGIAGFGLYGMQWLWGLFTFGAKMCGANFRKAFLPIHVFVGLTSYFFVTVAILLGILDMERILNVEFTGIAHWYNFLGMIVMITMSCVAFMLSPVSRTKDEEDDKNSSANFNGENARLKDNYASF